MTELRTLLFKAHQEAARRDNASTQILLASYQSNGNNLIGAITAAMNMLGGLHAPIKQTYWWIKDLLQDNSDVEYMTADRKYIPEFKSVKGRVPGFGSSFTYYEDPILIEVYHYFSIHHENYILMMTDMRQSLKHHGNELHPNIAFYTAAVALIEGIPINLCESLVLEARLPVWIELLNELEKK